MANLWQKSDQGLTWGWSDWQQNDKKTKYDK